MRRIALVWAALCFSLLCRGEDKKPHNWTKEEMGAQLGKEFQKVGTFKFDERQAEVVITEFEKVYQVNIVFSGSTEYLDKLDGTRFKVWALTRAGGVLPLIEGPDAQPAVAGNDLGGTPVIDFMLKHDADRKDIACIVAGVDDQFHVFPVPAR